MAKTRDKDGNIIDLTDEQLNKMYEMYEAGINNSREEVKEKYEERERQEKIVTEGLIWAKRAWEERLFWLKERSKLLRENSGAEDELQKIDFEIEVRRHFLYSAFQDLQVFWQWIEALAEESDNPKRVYGYATRIAEKSKGRVGSLEVAIEATEEEIKEIEAYIKVKGVGKKPNYPFQKYKGVWYVPVDKKNWQHRRVFRALENLRRKAKAQIEKERASRGETPGPIEEIPPAPEESESKE